MEVAKKPRITITSDQSYMSLHENDPKTTLIIKADEVVFEFSEAHQTYQPRCIVLYRPAADWVKKMKNHHIDTDVTMARIGRNGDKQNLLANGITTGLRISNIETVTVAKGFNLHKENTFLFLNISEKTVTRPFQV